MPDTAFQFDAMADTIHKDALSKVMAVMVNYNQEQEIAPLLQRLPAYFPLKQVIIVDDGSTDRSPLIARELGYTVLESKQNRGVGAAIRSGLRYAREHGYEYAVIMSSNGKIRPEDLATVLRPVLEGEADYVTGSRFISGGSTPGLNFFRRLSIPLFSLLVAPVLGRWFSDITCGYRCYTLKLFDYPQVNLEQSWLDRYEMEYYIHYWACKLKLRIREVPVTIPYLHLGKGRRSKIRPITGWWSMIRPFVLLGLGLRR